MDESKPSRHTIAQQLREQERHPIEDADRFEQMADAPKSFEAIHLGRDGSIALVYRLDTAVEGTMAGQVIEFDLMEDDDE